MISPIPSVNLHATYLTDVMNRTPLQESVMDFHNEKTGLVQSYLRGELSREYYLEMLYVYTILEYWES